MPSRPESAAHRAAVAFYTASAVATLGTGLVYALKPTPMPHHVGALDTPWSEQPDNTRLLIRTLFNGAGFATTGAGVGMMALARGPFRKGEAWAGRTVFAVGALMVLPTIGIATRLQVRTGAQPPMGLLGIALGLTVSGGAFQRLSNRDASAARDRPSSPKPAEAAHA